jgi:predicted component of type VI protein secretion system
MMMPDEMAKFPSGARVDVTEIRGRGPPGCGFSEAPYQLDELTISLRLVANLPLLRKDLVMLIAFSSAFSENK